MRNAKAYMAAYYAKNKERMKSQAKLWYARNRVAQIARNRERFTGVTPALFDALMDHQNAACAICRRPFTEALAPCADHCHAREEPRGLLCRACNRAEGFIRGVGLTPEEFVARLRAYLESPPAIAVLVGSNKK